MYDFDDLSSKFPFLNPNDYSTIFWKIQEFTLLIFEWFYLQKWFYRQKNENLKFHGIRPKYEIHTMNFDPSSRPVFEMPSRHLLYWLGNILKVCTVYYTSECSIDSFERTDSPWERIEKWIEQIEKTPGDDNVVVETNHHWFNHTGISNTLKYLFQYLSF